MSRFEDYYQITFGDVSCFRLADVVPMKNRYVVRWVYGTLNVVMDTVRGYPIYAGTAAACQLYAVDCSRLDGEVTLKW